MPKEHLNFSRRTCGALSNEPLIVQGRREAVGHQVSALWDPVEFGYAEGNLCVFQ
jgi:hypothetical protein